jgi:hypothetical protein
MGNAHQVDKGIGRANQLAVSIGIERIAGNDFASGGQLAFRPGTHQYANPMSPIEENRNQSAADVAGSSRDEDAPGVGRLGQRLDFQQEPDIGHGCSHNFSTLLEGIRMVTGFPVVTTCREV